MNLVLVTHFLHIKLLPPLRSTLFPYTTLFRSQLAEAHLPGQLLGLLVDVGVEGEAAHQQQLAAARSEEHSSELQSRFDLVCRLLLEKKNRLLITSMFNSHLDGMQASARSNNNN